MISQSKSVYQEVEQKKDNKQMKILKNYILLVELGTKICWKTDSWCLFWFLCS